MGQFVNVLQTRSPIIPKYFSVFQTKATLLNNYVTDIQIGKLTLIYFCHLIHRSHSSFAICLNRVLYRKGGTSLAVQWLRLCTSTAGGLGSNPGQGTKILHATWCCQREKQNQLQDLCALFQLQCLFQSRTVP